MNPLEALLLGVVQGLTEFLPISSSGHLILVPWLQDYHYLATHEHFNKTFDVALHLGTLVGVLVYFRREIVELIAGAVGVVRRRAIETPAARLLHLDRDSAARFSFLLLAPITAGAVLVKGAKVAKDGLPHGAAGPTVVGVVAAAITGYMAIAWMLAYVRRRSYDVFVVYRVVAALS